MEYLLEQRLTEGNFKQSLSTMRDVTMPFTKLGGLIAGIVFFLGCIQIAMALGVAAGAIIEPRPGLFMGHATTEQALDSGLMKILAAVAFGVITEISRSVEKNK